MHVKSFNPLLKNSFQLASDFRYIQLHCLVTRNCENHIGYKKSRPLSLIAGLITLGQFSTSIKVEIHYSYVVTSHVHEMFEVCIQLNQRSEHHELGSFVDEMIFFKMDQLLLEKRAEPEAKLKSYQEWISNFLKKPQVSKFKETLPISLV